MITEGIVAFCNLAETESYNGKDTGKYNITLTLDEADASVLREEGVHVKDYEDKDGNIHKQRKFSSKYPIDVLDLDDNVVSKHIPYGSKVRVKWKIGNPHPQWGTSTYLEKVRILELSERTNTDDEPF